MTMISQIDHRVDLKLTLNGSRKSMSLVSLSPNGIIGITGSALKNNTVEYRISSSYISVKFIYQ